MSTAIRRAALALGLLLGLTAGASAGEALKIDPQHSTVSFRVRHLFTTVQGQFRHFEGSLDFDEKALAASSVKATIKVPSIDTNVEARDKDLRSARFFDADKFPTLTFVSTKVVEVAGGRGKVRGIQTMHGTAQEVVLNTEFLGKAKDPWGNTRYGFHAETRVNRKDFGMAWNETLEAGGVLVGDEVDIVLEIEAVPAS